MKNIITYEDIRPLNKKDIARLCLRHPTILPQVIKMLKKRPLIDALEHEPMAKQHISSTKSDGITAKEINREH